MQKEKLKEIYYKMSCARLFDQTLNDLFTAGKMHGTAHLSVGQEGTAVGVVSALRKEDLVMSTHRGHSITIAKGADPRAMMAELFGRATGCCKGIGGSLHIVDIKTGNYGANGIMGASISIATGIALALQKDADNRIIASFFGDGSSNSGLFHESLNMAALWKLPIIYICENNLYGMSTPIEKSVSVKHVAQRAAAYGIPGKTIDGNDVLAVMQAVSEASERARSGGGPTLLELKTYRWLGHSKSDIRAYRTREEEQQWQQKCPLRRFAAYMCENGFSELEIKQIASCAEQTIQQAVAFAEASPLPDFDEALSLVYAKGDVNK